MRISAIAICLMAYAVSFASKRSTDLRGSFN